MSLLDAPRQLAHLRYGDDDVDDNGDDENDDWDDDNDDWDGTRDGDDNEATRQLAQGKGNENYDKIIFLEMTMMTILLVLMIMSMN